ncbi:MAG: hypothetical protein QOJ79_2678 [Actinomycetota bacterium]|nr:hypothetical protein [Actinomycetota bacterium]
MSDTDAVRTALLEMGLEDWIPVPEAVQTIRGCGSSEPAQEVREALTALGREGCVRFWRGVWNGEAEHVEVPAADAERLLTDERWFRFRLDEEDEERLYFVNVANVLAEDR